MKWGAQQGLGVVVSRWLGDGKAKAQGREIWCRAIACHHCHVLFWICLCISAFCLDEEGCYRTSVLCTHVHEFLYIWDLFHFIYFLVKHTSNIWCYMLDLIIGRHTWNCQIRTHIRTKIPWHTNTQRKKSRTNSRKGKKKGGGSGKKGKQEKVKGQKEKEGGKTNKGKKMGGEKKGKNKEWGGWVQGGRGAWVLRRVGPHTNNARSTWMFFSFHHLQKDKQHHSLCEARYEKTREFQTQWLYCFSKSDNKSIHQHRSTMDL